MAEFESTAPDGICTHRWQIQTPVGDECRGVCRLCGAERCFTNQRFAFGQPGHSRRPVPPVKAVPLPRPEQPGGLAQFLARGSGQPPPLRAP